MTTYSATRDSWTHLSHNNVIQCIDKLWVKIVSSTAFVPWKLELDTKLFEDYLKALPWEKRIAGAHPVSLPYMIVRKGAGITDHELNADLNSDLHDCRARFLSESGVVLGQLID